MYTKARIADHPIHPMLIGFPVALYTATVVVLFVHVGTHDAFWYHVAFFTNVAAVVMAAIAAVPGLVDLTGLPAFSKARNTALRHAGANVLALLMFTLSAIIIGVNWYSRPILDNAAPLTLDLIGLGSTAVAGWLGWTLVQTHHVGVKPTEYAPLSARPAEEIDDLDELIQPIVTTYVESHDIRMRH